MYVIVWCISILEIVDTWRLVAARQATIGRSSAM